jgi:hypothetical protein
VISACIAAGAFLILVLRTMLARENARREKEERDETYDDVYIQREKDDGTKVEQRVDKVSSGHHVLKLEDVTGY